MKRIRVLALSILIATALPLLIWGAAAIGASASGKGEPDTSVVVKVANARIADAAPLTIQSSIYDDTYHNGWADQSWSTTVNPNATAYVHTGTHSMSVHYSAAYAGLQITVPSFDTTGYSALTMFINGGTANGRDIGINFLDQFGDPITTIEGGALTFNNYVPGGRVLANTWLTVTIPLSDLGAENAQVGALILISGNEASQPTFFLDDIGFTGEGTPTPTMTVTGTPPTETPTPTPTMTLPPVPTGTPASGLPPIPAGLPTHFGFGYFNADPADLNAPVEYRYQYLAGGVNTGDGWATWSSPAGQYALDFVNQSVMSNTIPAFVYYQALQSLPGDDITNLRNNSTMNAYYADWKLLMQKIREGTSGPAVVIIEPDLDGDWMQDPSNTADNAALQPASVASSGFAEVQGLPNTFRGYWQALAHIRDLYAPNVLLAQDLSIWGPGDDLTIALRDDPNYDWQTHATRLGNYHASFGPGFQLLSFSPLDRDAAYYMRFYGSMRWWDDNNVVEPTFNTFAAWLGQIVQQSQLRVLMWQVPNGNRVYRSENNTDGHFQDNRPEYFLNPTSGMAHLSEWANAGVVGIMWGAGASGPTHYFDSKADGVTNPHPLDGTSGYAFGNPQNIANTQTALYPDDDGGYLRLRLNAYYQGGPLPLPGAVHCYGAQDAAALHAAFGSQRGDPNYNAAVDYNNDGIVNAIDAAILRQRYDTCQ